MDYDLLIRGGTVVTPSGAERLDIGIKDGVITELLSPSSNESATEVLDAQGLHVFPGVIDPHTHFGFGGDRDWLTESRSAAIGGVTTVINYVMGAASYFEQVPREREAADAMSCIDYALHVVPCTSTHLDELHAYSSELGVGSFKYFMNFRGDEGAYLGVEGTDDAFLFEYLNKVGEVEGLVANIHAENIEIVWALRPRVRASGLEGLAAWDAERPAFVEAEGIVRSAFYADLAGAPLYVVHVSAAACLDEIRQLRSRPRSAPLYAETCPHYLTHTVDSGYGTRAKVNPPVRHAEDVVALWDALADGTVQTVGSDHVARHVSFKDKDIWSASAGMPGAASILTVLLSEGYHRRGLPLETIAELTSGRAAEIFGLAPRKGRLAPGADADLAIVDLEAEQHVTTSTWESGAEYNLYEGQTLKGWPTHTVRRGEVLYRRGEVLTEPGTGIYLGRHFAAG
jgi:dihydropyrimidinase